MTEAPHRIRFTDVEKTYGGRRVLGPLSLELNAGEVLGLCGENGAGKSTFLRLALGLEQPTVGTVTLTAVSAGMVHQHYSLVDELTIAENVWLGAEPRSILGFDTATATQATTQLAAELGFQLEPTRLVSDLSVSEKQRVEWLKAMRHKPQVLLLDEPTATLTPDEISATLELITRLAKAGTAIVFVTHKLRETFAVCDRIAVLSHGQVTLCASKSELSTDAVAIAMVGHAVEATSPIEQPSADAKVALSVEALAYGRLQSATFTVREGEIFGIAGVEGNGQSELFAALVGVAKPRSGQVLMLGQDTTKWGPHQRRQLGLRFVPADRHHEGLLLDQSAAENLRLGQTNAEADAMLVAAAGKLMADVGVDPAIPTLVASAFSGGNQQKLLFARELAHRHTSSPAGRIYLVREPTRGVDFAAQARLWEHLREAARGGAAVVVMSSDIDELMTLCHRVCVLYRGKTSDIVTHADATKQWLGKRLGGLS